MPWPEKWLSTPGGQYLPATTCALQGLRDTEDVQRELIENSIA